MKKILLACLATVTLSFGSATIIKGSTQTVSFDSNPQGATVKIDGIATCQTPCSALLKNGHKSKMVSFYKDGYETLNIPMNSEFSGVTFLSIIWDLSTTDLLTGSAYEYAPNNFMAELKKK